MNEIGDFNAARKCALITLTYQTTEDNLDGSPWPPRGALGFDRAFPANI
jgi:hypothetical protein